MTRDAPLKNWQQRLRMLSSMVDILVTAGDVTNPTDTSIVDALAQAEQAARRAYYDSRHQADKAQESEPGLVRRPGPARIYRGSNPPMGPIGVILSEMGSSIDILAVPSLQNQYQNVAMQTLLKQPQAAQSANEFRNALVACTLGPILAEPLLIEIQKVVALTNHLTSILG